MAEHPVQRETIKHTQTTGKEVPAPSAKQDEIKMEPGSQ